MSTCIALTLISLLGCLLDSAWATSAANMPGLAIAWHEGNMLEISNQSQTKNFDPELAFNGWKSQIEVKE